MQANRNAAERSHPSRANVLEDVKTIVGEQMGMAPQAIRETSELERDLGCDSLDRVEIAMEVEDHFGIDVPDDVADAIRTVRDIVDGVMRQMDIAVSS